MQKVLEWELIKSLMVFDMPYNTYKNKKSALLNVKKVIKKLNQMRLNLREVLK